MKVSIVPSYNRRVRDCLPAARTFAVAALFVWAPGSARAQVCPGPGLTIGTIGVERLEVLSPGDMGSLSGLGRAANGLHARTREHVVRRELLFAPGEACDDERLAQSERNLRALGLFQDVSITPAPPRDGVTDVTVRVRDAWTLRVGADLSHEGGFTSWEARASEDNLGGYGLVAGVRYRRTFERDIASVWAADHRLFGTRERLWLSWEQRSDGWGRAVSLTKPFHTLDTPWGHDLSWRDVRDHLLIYEGGLVSERYGRRMTDANLTASRRVGGDAARDAWRLTAGYAVRLREHERLPDEPSPSPPPSHRWAGPVLGLQRTSHRYVKARGLIVPGRDLDLNLGLSGDLSLFVSPRMTSAETEARVFAGASVSGGFRLPGGGLAVAGARGTAGLGGLEPQRGDIAGDVRAWWQPSPHHVVALLAEGRALVTPESGSLLYLGGSAGLRGFPQNAWSGTRRMLVVLEERRYVDWTPLGLVRPGFVAFVEVGRVGGDPAVTSALRTHGVVGAGLRLALLRGAGHSAARLDLAWPVTPRPDGTRRPQLVLGYRGDF